jgi:hypothetical protein
VSTWTVTTFEPKVRQIHDGDDGKARIHLDWRLTPTESGCGLSHTMDLQPVWYLAPVMAVMWPLVLRKRAQQALDGTMGNIKRIVEAGDS